MFSSIGYDIYTYGDTERIHETEHMQIKYLQIKYAAAITRRKGETRGRQ